MTPDEFRLLLREELLAAGIGEPQLAAPIYDQAAEEMVLGAVVDGETTIEALAPFHPDHCAVPWIHIAMLSSGTLDERLALMKEHGFPQTAIDQARRTAELSPIVAEYRVRESAIRISELHRRRALARACRRVACEMEADAVSYEEAVATLRATIVGLRT